MEIKMNEMQLPEKIGFNYEELKHELSEKVSMYETMVYTDEQIKDAKADKANLNKLKKALNDERIRREKEYMKPFNEFKEKVNEIISIIDKPILVIDRQVKEYEEKRKQDKKDNITSYWQELLQADKIPEGMTLNQIWDEKWLNASVSIKAIKEEIQTKIEQVETDMKIISNLPEFAFEAMEVYKSSHDVRKALDEANRLAEIAKRKAEQERLAEERRAEQERLAEERRKAEQERLAEEAEKQEEFIPPIVDDLPFEEENNEEDSESFENFIPDFTQKLEKKWVVLKANITTDDEAALKEFMESRNIEFELF